MEHMITIEAGSYTARINLSRGANCISFRNRACGAVILREPKENAEWDNPYLYGMPILYPVNRIAGGRFEFEGRTYAFPINEPDTDCHLHGELHRTEFAVAEQRKDYIRCSLRTEGSYPGFPHAYEITIAYSLSEEGLRQETEITNLSGENMPNFLGFHTTFCVPFLEGSGAEDVRVLAQVGQEIERDMRVYLPTGRMLPEDEITKKLRDGSFQPLEKRISRHYKAEQRGIMELRDLKRNISVVYENDRKFPWRLLYNGNAEEYICLEPMTCIANCQNGPFDRAYAGFDFIKPGVSKKYVSRIFLKMND